MMTPIHAGTELLPTNLPHNPWIIFYFSFFFFIILITSFLHVCFFVGFAFLPLVSSEVNFVVSVGVVELV